MIAHMWNWACAACLVAIAAVSALAGDLPAAAAPAVSGGVSHSWVALPTADGGSAIVHLPRRIAGPPGADAEDGSVRLATRLPARPERLAAWDATVYLAFPAEELGGGKRHRRVVSLTVEQGPIGGSWVSDTDARLPVLPSLPGDGWLDGFVGSSPGPAALIREKGDAGLRRYALLLYDGSRWQGANLPDQWWGSTERRAGASLRLVASADGLALLTVGGERPGLWTATLPARPSADGWALEWQFRGLSFEAAGRAAPPPDSPVYLTAGHLVYASRTPDGRTAEIWSPTPARCLLLQRVRGIAEDVAVASLDQVGRLGLVWQEYPEDQVSGQAKRSASEPRTRVVEVSVTSGQVLYDGPAKVGAPVSQQELKILAVLLVGVMAVVLLFVLRPDARGAPLTLPKGVTLAEPGRRLVAGFIDLAAAALIASGLARASPMELLTPAHLLNDPESLEAILMVLGIGCLHCTLGEGLFGRSLGKALSGCEVARVVIGKTEDGSISVALERPALWRAAVRNLVRWAIPPLALSGLSSMDHRHRGDLAAGTVVIVRGEEAA
jgi:hypothetical protein